MKTVDDLDYEFRKQFILAVKVYDVRGGESTANVAIELQDVNDNTAIFAKPVSYQRFPYELLFLLWRVKNHVIYRSTKGKSKRTPNIPPQSLQ